MERSQAAVFQRLLNKQRTLPLLLLIFCYNINAVTGSSSTLSSTSGQSDQEKSTQSKTSDYTSL